MDAEAASAARDLIAIARAAADWFAKMPTAGPVTHGHIGDLRDAALRLSAVTPPLPNIDAMRLSLEAAE